MEICNDICYILFDVHVTVHRDEFLTIKQTRCTNFSNLFLEWNSQFLCPSSGVFHCTHSSDICHTGVLVVYEQDQEGTSWSCTQAVSKSVWHIPLLCVQWKTPDDGQKNCPKHVKFHSKNKFEKLVHLVRFIVRNFYILDRLRVPVTLTQPNLTRYCYIIKASSCSHHNILPQNNGWRNRKAKILRETGDVSLLG
jgi:hypothetical protein